jgi:two-component system nitrogen regulation sensor histidine kinase NtrY
LRSHPTINGWLRFFVVILSLPFLKLTASAKIRLLLALLFASLLLTAIVVQKTYTSKNNLLQTAQSLEKNLHHKEQIVWDVINDAKGFQNLKTLDTNDNAALKAIQDFTTDEGIWLITAKKGKLAFWSGVKIIPEWHNKISEGFSFIRTANGYYDAIKKTQGDFYAIFFIPVKANYPFQNQYLVNTFNKNLLTDNNIEIAAFYDKNIYEVNSITGKYLFSVKVNDHLVSHRFFYFEVGVWTLAFIVLCLLVHNCCNYIALKGYPYLAFMLLGLFIILIRILNIFYGWPDFVYRPTLFAPHMFNDGNLYPSFGDFCINILAASWFVCFVYRFRDKLTGTIQNKAKGYAVVAGSVLLLIIVSTSLLSLFYRLVIHSTINFDVNNVLSLSIYSFLGILMLCFAFLIFYVLAEICLTLCSRTSVPINHQAGILLFGMVVATIISAITQKEFTLFYAFWAIWVLIRGYAYNYSQGRLNSGALVSIILVCAVVASTKLSHFQSIKEVKIREDYLNRLATADDPQADEVFNRVEQFIQKDETVRNYMADSVYNNDYLKNYLQKLYFPALSKYSTDVLLYDANDQPLPPGNNFDLSVFKDMVVLTATKVSHYFYRTTSSFGVSNYFALIPLSNGDNKAGTLVIQLKSRKSQAENTYPDLLVEDTGSGSTDEYRDYSYAFYTDNRLQLQHGNYDYSLFNTEFKGTKLKDYVFRKTSASTSSGIDLWTSYSHLIYRLSPRDVLVVTKKQSLVLYIITSVTFFFIVFLGFSVLVILTRWLWTRIRILYIENNYFHWRLKLNFDNILYKTRIQFSIVFAVVITLVLVGIITYFSLAQQYSEQQDNTIIDRVGHIGQAFTTKAGFGEDLSNPGPEFNTRFNNFANTYAADLTLFAPDGTEIISTQPKIYDDGLIAKRINGRAFISLNKQHKSVWVNNETIGQLNYKAGYATIESKNKVLGYLELPYFSNDVDYRSRLSSVLNAMINVYALIFIAIGLLAIIIARQITTPLSIIQQSLSKTIYGQKNEPIKWNRRDEIGTLVAEYNTMISTLEQSAQKLAQSERESAWREMAKQVAHEIKNPLTPLKLGLQLLEKSWRDKDPKFDQKFERFSKSFVEQIESLSSIASEFSAFAKMPETRIERLNVFEVLTQAVVVFKQMDNIRISFQAPEQPFTISADRDQLLRCFNNLLKNAIEAIPQGQQGLIEISSLITNKNILLSIKDNGNGIPENLREKIFEPNFTTKSSGTGLGLAFVKNSIENAGGKVWFETAIGKGTTFYISLPEA